MDHLYILNEDQIKELATHFFYDWYNSPGSNTEQGFDAWWKLNKAKYQNPTQKAIDEIFNSDFTPRFKAGDMVRVVSGARITYTNMPEPYKAYLIRHVYGGEKWTYALSDLHGRDMNIHINDEHVELIARAEKPEQPTPGVCKECGCTWENACQNPEHGNCWWVDDTETLCSHCYIDEIKNDPKTIHPENHG